MSGGNQDKAAVVGAPWWVQGVGSIPASAPKLTQTQGGNCSGPTAGGSTFVMQFCSSAALGKVRYSLRQLLQWFRFWGRGAPTGNSFNNYTLFGQSVIQHTV